MAILRASNAPLGLNRGKPTRASGSALALWQRPADWISLTTPGEAEQKAIGVVAVFNQASNYVALAATTSAGTYTVDWGDGTTTTHTSAATAEKNYVWGDISSGTLSSRGYRQAVITVTPTTGGATFSAVNLNRRHSGITSAATITSNPWLDIVVAAPNATTIAFVYETAGTRAASMTLCEQVNIVAHNLTNMAHIFNEFRKLKSVLISNTAAVTNMANMFQSCTSLQTIPLLNTAALTTATNMFNGCTSLQTIPLLNTAALTNATSMFQTCSSLQTIPLLNTAALTTATSMFNGCTSLQTIPLLNTAALTTATSMFQGCTSLQTIPLLNTAALTTAASMFQNCTSLQTIPELNLAAVSSAANNALGIGSAGANSACASLGQAKPTGNRWTQTFQNCRMGAAELNEMYTALATLNPAVTAVTGNGTTVTYTIADRRAFVAGRTVTMTGIDPVAYNLTNVTVGTVTATTGNAGTFTVTNAATGTYVSGGVAAIQSDRIITVTGNPGTATHDTTIATNKGWQVTA